jgi:hypothetical protein
MENSRPTALMYAAFYGATQRFNYLALAGADWEAMEDSNETVVHHAIAGADDDGCTPL